MIERALAIEITKKYADTGAHKVAEFAQALLDEPLIIAHTMTWANSAFEDAARFEIFTKYHGALVFDPEGELAETDEAKILRLTEHAERDLHNVINGGRSTSLAANAMGQERAKALTELIELFKGRTGSPGFYIP